MKIIIFIAIGLLLVACGDSNRPPKPDNLIPEETMSEVMYDVFVLNAAKGINKKILETNGILPESYVFDKYNIDSLQFAKSNDYYSYDPETYEGIIERVKVRLELAKNLNDSMDVIEKKLKDSLDLAKRPKLKIDSIAIDSIKTKQNSLGEDN